MRSYFWKYFAMAALIFSVYAGGGDLGMKATLVWGCDDPMPKADNIKPVSPEVAKKLGGIFKWKHYYYVDKGQQEAKIAEKAEHKFVLSDKCTVEVKNEGKQFTAKLHGEGKLLKTLNIPAKPGEDTVLAGDDKNATAWFVILTPKH